jgi:hypothetical protein
MSSAGWMIQRIVTACAHAVVLLHSVNVGLTTNMANRIALHAQTARAGSSGASRAWPVPWDDLVQDPVAEPQDQRRLSDASISSRCIFAVCFDGMGIDATV